MGKQLRKCMGKTDSPQCIQLMRMIETQSKQTLAAWAAYVVRQRYLPVYHKAFPEDFRLDNLLIDLESCLQRKLALKLLQNSLRGARAIPKEAEYSPAALAAARAVITAASVLQNPASALGFTFYGAAAAAYDQAGLDADPSYYDAIASDEFDWLVNSLRACLVADEPDPVKIVWNC